jgi:hypothetical protein
MSSYTPIAALEIIPGQPVKPSLFQRLDANDQAVPSPWVLLAGAVNTWTAPESKWYQFIITGKGGNGGAGGAGGNDDTSTQPTQGSSGGKAGSTGIVRVYVDKGTLWTATFSAVNNSANYTSFTDGVTEYRAGNLGGAVVNCDIDLLGGGQGIGGNGGDYFVAGDKGDSGGTSFWGSGGNAGAGGAAGVPPFGNGAVGTAGGAGISYGSGGGCGGGGGGSYDTVRAGGAGGAGAAGCVIIIG